jgi:hypothetical protein
MVNVPVSETTRKYVRELLGGGFDKRELVQRR